MPLTAKGEEIKASLVKEYGEKKGTSVLYAGKNSGRFTGIDSASFRNRFRNARGRGLSFKDALEAALPTHDPVTAGTDNPSWKPTKDAFVQSFVRHVHDGASISDAIARSLRKPRSMRDRVLDALWPNRQGSELDYSNGPFGGLPGPGPVSEASGDPSRTEGDPKTPMDTGDEHIGFGKLQGEIEKKSGYGAKEAAATAAAIGREKYGKKGMAEKSAAGRDAEPAPGDLPGKMRTFGRYAHSRAADRACGPWRGWAPARGFHT